MNTYTAHLKLGRPPVLVREGFSWGAFLFGPVWLLARRAWIAAILYAALGIAIAAAAPEALRVPVLFGLSVLAGLLGRDVVRWSLARRGYALAHVLAARDEDSAIARLLAARPELLQRYAESLA